MTESELKKKQCTKLVFDYLKIAVMAVLLALAYVLFIINNRFAPAGINGVATMIEYKLGFSVGYFSLIVNVPLSIVAFFYVDRDFALKSFAFTVIYSVSYILLEKADLSNFAYVANGTDTILPVLAAGIIGGKDLKYSRPKAAKDDDSFTVVDQYPKAGTKVKKNSVVYVYKE